MKKILLIVIGFIVIAVLAMVILTAKKGNRPIQNTILIPVPTQTATPEEKPLSHYIEIINGCGTAYDGGPCVNMRLGPSTSAPIAAKLRTGIVLKVEADTTQSSDGHTWYKIIFDKDIRYPERIGGDWYVAVDPTSVRPFEDIGDINLDYKHPPATNKRIVVDISQQKLYAYDGDTLFMEEPISTGLEFTPTPVGTFAVYKKTPSRYMQGPLPGVSDQKYDLPGVPWNLYFTKEGAVIHGAYWHNHFGEQWSHGCVNLEPETAKKLYEWADIGMPVTVQN